MKTNPLFDQKNIKHAFTIAVIADAIQLPVMLAMLGIVSIPALELADILVDILAMILIVSQIGFSFALLPSFALEAIPFVGALPTWTASVAFMAWQQKRATQPPPLVYAADPNDQQHRRSLPPPLPQFVPASAVVDVESRATRILTPTATRRLPPLPERVTPTGHDLETRLERLTSLRERGIITPDEFNFKREQLLNQL